MNRVLLAVALILTQLVTPHSIHLCVRLTYPLIRQRMSKERSNFKYYLPCFIFTFGLLGITGAVVNGVALRNNFSASGVDDVEAYYITAAVIIALNYTVNPFISTVCNACCFKKEHTKKETYWFVLSTLILVLSANSFSTNVIYALMGLVVAPIQTGALLFLYSSIFFFLTMVFSLILKGCNKLCRGVNNNGSNIKSADPESVRPEPNDPESVRPKPNDPESVRPKPNDPESVCPKLNDPESVRPKLNDPEPTNYDFKKPSKCDIATGCIIIVILIIDVFFYLAFYYQMAMAVQPYTLSHGFLSAFGCLVPAIFSVAGGMLGNRLITFLDANVFSGSSNNIKKAPKTDARSKIARSAQASDKTIPLVVNDTHTVNFPNIPYKSAEQVITESST